MIRHASLVVLASCVLAACGAASEKDSAPTSLDPGDAGDAGTTFDIGTDETGAFQEIQLTPSNAVLFIDGCTAPAKAAKQVYAAMLQNPDGSETDVSAEVVLTVDAPVGSFAGPEFTSVDTLPGGALGVTTVVHATARGKTGFANLTLASLRKDCDQRDFFFLEPYKGTPSPSRDVLKFGTNIKQVDLAFSVDTTGSMSGAIDNLKVNLSSKIFPGLKAAIPSVGLGVVDFKDETDIWVVKVQQTIVNDVAKAQTAAGKLFASGGGDEPEADVCAMMHIVTGKSCGSTAAHTPAPGTFGGVDFRPGALPVVVNVTDAHWHDPSGGYGLEKDLMPAMKSANVRFVGVTETHYSSDSGDLEDLANYLSDYTGSSVPPSAFGAGCAADQCCTGLSGAPRAVAGPKKQCRLNFLIEEGKGLSDSVVQAISALSVGSVFDVTAQASNDPANPDGVDATVFVDKLRAMDEGDPSSACPAHDAKDTNGDGVKDTFLTVAVGTPVCFEVIPKTNTTVPPKDAAQFFHAFIDVLGMPGSVKLDRRSVLFLVPPTDPVAR